jgi:surface protein
MTFEVAICLDDIGANNLVDPIVIYGNQDYYISEITSTTVSQLTLPNCPLILNNIPIGTTKLKIVDNNNLCAEIEIEEPQYFHFKIDTTKPGTTSNNQVKLPLISSGIYDIYVDWGDGGPWDNIKNWNDVKKTHTYASTGVYEIKIYSFPGNFIGWNYKIDPSDRLKLLEILKWGPIQLGNSTGHFSACTNLNIPNVVDTLNTSGMTSFSSLFESCTSLSSINKVSQWDTSKVNNMSYTFKNATVFNSDLSGWTTNNVTTMQSMFESATQFNKNIGNWKTLFCADMQFMFAGATNFDNNGSDTINDWDTSSVTKMNYMFYNAYNFNRNIGKWNVSKVKFFGYMFHDAKKFNNNSSPTINNWNTSSAEEMGHMFFSTDKFNQPLGNWNVKKVNTCCGFSQGLRSMFGSAVMFNQDLSNWDVSNVKTFRNMFNGASIFNNLGSPNISGWTTSAVTLMEGVFTNAVSFNQPIGSWDVSKVTTMESMFEGASQFNKDLSTWNVTGVTTMEDMFRNSSNFNQTLQTWKPINVTNLSGFLSGSSFSITNYNNLLIDWSVLTLKPNVQMNVSQNYNNIASSAKSILTSAPNNWIIIDNGLI